MEKEKKTWLVVGKKEWQIFLFHLRHNQKGRINIKLQNSCSDSLWFHIKKQKYTFVLFIHEVVSHFAGSQTAACQVLLSSTISWSLPKSMSIESVMLSNHLLLCTPFYFAFNLSQHQGLFQWAGSSHQVATVLELQYQSFQWILRVDFL